MAIDDAEFQRLASMPDAVVWTMSFSGEITSVSDSVLRVRGYTPQEAAHQRGDEIHPPASLRESLRYFEQLSRDLQAGRTPESFSGTLEYSCANGSTVWCTVRAVPVVGGGGDSGELRGVSVPVGGVDGVE